MQTGGDFFLSYSKIISITIENQGQKRASHETPSLIVIVVTNIPVKCQFTGVARRPQYLAARDVPQSSQLYGHTGRRCRVEVADKLVAVAQAIYAVKGAVLRLSVGVVAQRAILLCPRFKEIVKSEHIVVVDFLFSIDAKL